MIRGLVDMLEQIRAIDKSGETTITMAKDQNLCRKI